jgi:hypothetical protein
MKELFFPSNNNHQYIGKHKVGNKIQWNQKSSIEFVDGEFIVKTNTSSKESSSATEIKQLYDDWLMNNAQSTFTHMVEEYSKKTWC